MNAIARIVLPKLPQTDADIVDQLGQIKARIAELTGRERELKDELINRNGHEYAGEFYEATVSQSIRSTLDMDAVRSKLTHQFIAKHTTTTQTYTVRVVARKRVS